MITKKFISRNLNIKDENNNNINFNINIHLPIKNENDEYFCVVESENIIFKGKKKIYGFDEIEALNLSLKFIDFMMFENNSELEILWNDGSRCIKNLASCYDWVGE